ncbi:uncharacterized protein LOC122074594 [Macadamia integrifolia]|uniref:uncharacterized protein LOC122074594 n=1 Tax=Macadamia integrifolia TaxID=60698 RepID=UPI001C4F5541|nr:uncharacterized protein LOC122074594 [Macadamia integrifolia]
MDSTMADSSPHSEISYQDMAGHRSPMTLRLTGYIAGSSIQILVDGCSTHNFVQSRVARHLGLAIEAAPTITVLVGNGDRLSSEGIVKKLPVRILNHLITIDLLVLPIFGVDMVLGFQWLAQLGPMLFYYGRLSLEFMDGDTKIQLLGELSPSSPQMGYHAVRRLAVTGSYEALFQLEIQSIPKPTSVCENAELNDLLQSYSSVFDFPSGLPPSLVQDHSNHLQPGSEPALNAITV